MPALRRDDARLNSPVAAATPPPGCAGAAVHEVDEAETAKVRMRGLFDTKAWTVGAFRKAKRQETATSTCTNPEDFAKLTQTINGRGGFDREAVWQDLEDRMMDLLACGCVRALAPNVCWRPQSRDAKGLVWAWGLGHWAAWGPRP